MDVLWSRFQEELPPVHFRLIYDILNAYKCAHIPDGLAHIYIRMVLLTNPSLLVDYDNALRPFEPFSFAPTASLYACREDRCSLTRDDLL